MEVSILSQASWVAGLTNGLAILVQKFFSGVYSVNPSKVLGCQGFLVNELLDVNTYAVEILKHEYCVRHFGLQLLLHINNVYHPGSPFHRLSRKTGFGIRG